MGVLRTAVRTSACFFITIASPAANGLHLIVLIVCQIGQKPIDGWVRAYGYESRWLPGTDSVANHPNRP